MKLFYLSGASGSGKSYISKKLAEAGYQTFSELPDPFPQELYPDSRSLQTAKYIFEQMLKRDEMIRKSSGTVVVDRHPFDNILVAKGLLKNAEEFKKIEQLYLRADFVKGMTIKLEVQPEVLKERLFARNLALVDKQMWEDIIAAYESSYDKYLKPEVVLSEEDDILSRVLKIVSAPW